MKMPAGSPDMEAAVNNLHQHLSEIEVNLMSYLDQIATSGFSDKRWCAVARTDLEKGFMAAHRALRDYPGSDPNEYGKVPLDTPLPREFQPPPDPAEHRSQKLIREANRGEDGA